MAFRFQFFSQLQNRWQALWEWLDPTPMDWVNLAVALLLGGLPFLLMWFAHPKIEVEFDDRVSDSARGLECKIYNRPVNRFLRLLRVRRSIAEEVMASVEIRKFGTNDAIAPFYRAKIFTGDNDGAGRVQLSPSVTPVWLFVAKKLRENNYVIAYPGCDPRAQEVQLQPGKYLALIQLRIEGSKLVKEKHFIVSVTDPYMYWHDIS